MSYQGPSFLPCGKGACQKMKPTQSKTGQKLRKNIYIFEKRYLSPWIELCLKLDQLLFLLSKKAFLDLLKCIQQNNHSTGWQIANMKAPTASGLASTCPSILSRAHHFLQPLGVERESPVGTAKQSLMCNPKGQGVNTHEGCPCPKRSRANE